jgi:hypothetical protein
MSDIVKSPYGLGELFDIIRDRGWSFDISGVSSITRHRTAYHVEIRNYNGHILVNCDSYIKKAPLPDVLYTAMRPLLGEDDA